MGNATNVNRLAVFLREGSYQLPDHAIADMLGEDLPIDTDDPAELCKIREADEKTRFHMSSGMRRESSAALDKRISTVTAMLVTHIEKELKRDDLTREELIALGCLLWPHRHRLNDEIHDRRRKLAEAKIAACNTLEELEQAVMYASDTCDDSYKTRRRELYRRELTNINIDHLGPEHLRQIINEPDIPLHKLLQAALALINHTDIKWVDLGNIKQLLDREPEVDDPTGCRQALKEAFDRERARIVSQISQITDLAKIGQLEISYHLRDEIAKRDERQNELFMRELANATDNKNKLRKLFHLARDEAQQRAVLERLAPFFPAKASS